MKRAVIMITDLVNEGRTITEIHSELSSANLAIPQTQHFSNALLSIANAICNSKGIDKITIEENIDSLSCTETENKALSALITALEATCITSLQVHHLLEASHVVSAPKTSVIEMKYSRNHM